MDTKSKIALVTGGSRGLGKNMALHLAQKGIHVILTYNSKKEEALAVVAEIEKAGCKAADRFDFLINNAGVGIYGSFAETTEEQFDTLMNIHFKGVFFLTQKALPFIQDGGRIINLSTGLARFSMPGYSAYASMKGAMETLTKYQAKELGARGIAVNIIAPGAIETDFGGGRVRDDAGLNQHVAALTALGRVGLPDDIGGVVAFLCTDDAKWINAQRIEVSGGMNL